MVERSREKQRHRACVEGKSDAAEFLLQMGADLNSVDDGGRSCLDVAGANSHAEITKLL